MRISKNGLIIKPQRRLRKPDSQRVKKALARRGGGRVSYLDLLTEKKLEEMLTLLRNGVSPYTAASCIGIPPARFCNYMTWGREGKAPYASFRDKVLTAQQDAVADAEQTIKVRDPLAYLTKGPVRHLKEEKLPDGSLLPGWDGGADRKLRLTGADGESSARVELVFSASGPSTKTLPAEGSILTTAREDLDPAGLKKEKGS